MADLSEEMVAIAVELIDEYGGEVTFNYAKRAATYDENTAKMTGGTTIAPATVKALIEDKGLWLGKELGVMGEKKLTVASEGLNKPEPNDKFTVNGETFKVMDKGTVTTYCQGSPVLYEVYGVRS